MLYSNQQYENKIYILYRSQTSIQGRKNAWKLNRTFISFMNLNILCILVPLSSGIWDFGQLLACCKKMEGIKLKEALLYSGIMSHNRYRYNINISQVLSQNQKVWHFAAWQMFLPFTRLDNVGKRYLDTFHVWIAYNWSGCIGWNEEYSIMIFIGSWSSNGCVRVKSWGDTPWRGVGSERDLWRWTCKE